jgi:TolA-binding protein
MESSQMDEHSSRQEQEHEFDDPNPDVHRDRDVTRQVPVTESIRYRRRAQSAEKSAQDLADRLAQANEQITQMSEDLESLRFDRKLTDRLTEAGVTDLESAMLIAKSRMEGNADIDVEELVTNLKTEKRHLFARASEPVTARKTNGARDRAAPGRTALEQAAAKAAQTGKRADLQEYLRLRRNVL